jgi:hypothetical protein
MPMKKPSKDNVTMKSSSNSRQLLSIPPKKALSYEMRWTPSTMKMLSGIRRLKSSSRPFVK